MTTAAFLADLHTKAQAQRFSDPLPLPEVGESGFGDFLAEPLLEMLMETDHV